ncbi:hypothetical protein D3C71_1887480 [compost metagenome]
MSICCILLAVQTVPTVTAPSAIPMAIPFQMEPAPSMRMVFMLLLPEGFISTLRSLMLASRRSSGSVRRSVTAQIPGSRP